jgi:hypothetical protein
MTKRLLHVAGAVVAVGASFGLAALSRAPLAAYPDDAPVLRLAWSVRPERIERCRTLTDAELADVPAHMRQRVQCEGRSATYRLVAMVDGGVRLDTMVTGGGARNDRPVYVFRELGLPAGNHRLTVRFEREPVAGAGMTASDDRDDGAASDDTLMAARAPREAEERTRRQEEAVPPMLELVADIAPADRDVLLVTYDIDRRALILRTRAPVP